MRSDVPNAGRLNTDSGSSPEKKLSLTSRTSARAMSKAAIMFCILFKGTCLTLSSEQIHPEAVAENCTRVRQAPLQCEACETKRTALSGRNQNLLSAVRDPKRGENRRKSF